MCLQKSIPLTLMLFDLLLFMAQLGRFYSILTKQNGIVYVQNEDKRCFRFAIASAIYPVNKYAHRPQMLTQYFKENGLDDIEYPVNQVYISLFVQRLNISINL